MAAQAMGSCYHTGPCEGEEDPPVLGGNMLAVQWKPTGQR